MYTNAAHLYFGCFLVFLWLLFLFLIIGVTADDFFCPVLSAIADMLGLSETLAGVTLLAFGNGCTDFLTSIAGVTKSGPEIVVSQLLGAGVFVTTVVMGAIIFSQPFIIPRSMFLRDVIFYLVGVLWIVLVVGSGVLRLWKPIVLILMYGLYIGAVLLDAFLERRRLMKTVSGIDAKRLKSVSKFELIVTNSRGSLTAVDFDDRTTSMLKILEKSLEAIPDDMELDTLDRGQSKSVLLIEQPPPTITINEQPYLDADIESFILPPPLIPRARSVNNRSKLDLVLGAERLKTLTVLGQDEQANIERNGFAEIRGVLRDGATAYFRPGTMGYEFFYEMIPLDVEEWMESGCGVRMIIIFKAPIIFILKLLVPVVNHAALNNGWCKLLNTLHCVTSLMFISYCLNVHSYRILPHVYVWMLVFFVGCLLAAWVYNSSQQEIPPPYHSAFAVLGFFVSFNFIFCVAQEIMHLLFSFGVMLNISQAILGLTILAWGNSIGDVISNISLAKRGYPRMAFAACFGGPLLNNLIGLGVSLVIYIIQHGTEHLEPHFGLLASTCSLFLFMSLVSSLILVPLLSFHGRPTYSLYLFVLYFCFLLYTLLAEAGILDALNRDSCPTCVHHHHENEDHH